MVFASEKTSLSLQLVMNKEATGAVYFDRVSVAEYQNDLENASFEDQGELVGDTFDDWEEVHSGGVVEVGDGILTEDSAKITRTDPGVAPTEIWQTQGVLAGKTYELTALMKGENLVGARTFIMVEMAGYPPYYVEGPGTGDSGWGLYRGHYVAPAQDDLKVHLGIDGGTGVVYFEDVGMKEVPDVCENNDFEENYVEPEDTIGFVGWTYELNGGDVGLEPLPYMNHAAAQLMRASDGGVRSVLGGVKNLLGGGFDDDPIGNTILKQRINCLPRTEYEVTIFAKHNITAKNDYYGAFAVVGNITGSMQIDAITVYTGDFVEIFNLEVGSSDWTAYTARFTSTEDWFEITLGVGATAVGSASFDAVLLRDLTTRRYEYIYGLGRKLATLEYEGNVPEGQVYFDHHDVLASPVMRTDIDGDVVWKGDYAPFGETLEEQPVTRGSQYRFLGNEDDGGLMDFGARFYDPRVGRFISADPIKDVSSANVVNPYVYCANNPLKYTDKFGLRAGRAPYSKVSDEPSAGGGGGHATGFGWEAMDPIPFYGYPVYYGASWNGQAAWFHNNAVAWREQARREMAKAASGGALDPILVVVVGDMEGLKKSNDAFIQLLEDEYGTENVTVVGAGYSEGLESGQILSMAEVEAILVNEAMQGKKYDTICLLGHGNELDGVAQGLVVEGPDGKLVGFDCSKFVMLNSAKSWPLKSNGKIVIAACAANAGGLPGDLRAMFGTENVFPPPEYPLSDWGCFYKTSTGKPLGWYDRRQHQITKDIGKFLGIK